MIFYMAPYPLKKDARNVRHFLSQLRSTLLGRDNPVLSFLARILATTNLSYQGDTTVRSCEAGNRTTPRLCATGNFFRNAWFILSLLSAQAEVLTNNGTRINLGPRQVLVRNTPTALASTAPELGLRTSAHQRVSIDRRYP